MANFQKIGMVFGFCVFLLLSGCHSEKKMLKRGTNFVALQPVEVVVNENVQDTMIRKQPDKPKTIAVVAKSEDVSSDFCVIMGSFMDEANALHLRQRLIKQGFLGTSVMQSRTGMYRVSAVCMQSHAEAWRELCRIRVQYPQFRTAWLLSVEK